MTRALTPEPFFSEGQENAEGVIIWLEKPPDKPSDSPGVVVVAKTHSWNV